MKDRRTLSASKSWIIKVGSSLLTNDGRGLDKDRIAGWVQQIAQLRASGKNITLVSSGAVAEGMNRLGWKARPKAVHELQAAAAVGQMGLVQAYESAFHVHGIHTAQILLTHDDLADRRRYLNARSTLQTLLKLGVIPIINENDTVAVDEIRLGDNDTLGAMVANLLGADVLVLLTDQAGMFEDDPRKNPQAKFIRAAPAGDSSLENMATAHGAGTYGRGGMLTKVRAAARAARSGTATLIASGREPSVLARLAAGEEIGTLLYPATEPLAARKHWLSVSLNARGRIKLDDGAVRVLKQSGRSLLAVGVQDVEGDFERGELVVCLGSNGLEVARGLVNYSAAEARIIKGHPSDKIESLLGYIDEPELIHRDNLVLT